MQNDQTQQNNPDTFKQLITSTHPNGVASDGRAYKDIPSQELTQMVVNKYPTGVTKTGTPYKSYLTQPQIPQNSNAIPSKGGTPLNPLETAKGIVKGGLQTTIGTAQLLQDAGKWVANKVGITPLPTGQQNPQLGLSSLDTSTPEGAGVNASIQPNNQSQKVGSTLETIGELGAGFVGDVGKVKTGVTEGVQLAKEARTGLLAAREAKATEQATSKITEMISPKPTVKEARIATTQGRFVEGKEPTLFKAGTEDIIKPSPKTLSASQTIQKNIPNASKMSPSELYTAVDKNISETAQKLRPQMEATPIQPQTIEKINTDWEALKKTQMADAPATEEANVAKRQAKFESLLQKSGNQSHADLWDTAIKYDNSVPENVKKATSLSPESQQLQKQEWLDNRQILSDALEKSSRPEFKAMSDMYNAKTGLLSKAKVDKAQLSKINQFLKDNPKTAKVLGGATIYEVAKHLGFPLP